MLVDRHRKLEVWRVTKWWRQNFGWELSCWNGKEGVELIWELSFLKSQKDLIRTEMDYSERGVNGNPEAGFLDFLTDKNSQGSLFKIWILGHLFSKKRILNPQVKNGIWNLYFKKKHKRIWSEVGSTLKKYHSQVICFHLRSF